MRFRATVVTAPEFELPEYKRIPVQLPDDEGDARQRSMRRWNGCAINPPISSTSPERGVAMEDFAVIDFEGSDRRQSRSARSCRRRARICRAERSSGCGSRRIIFCRSFASRWSGRSLARRAACRWNFRRISRAKELGGQDRRTTRSR